MSSAKPTIHEFECHPSFEKIEEFLRFYQSLHQQNKEAVIQCPLPAEYLTTIPGYPDVERNCWLTLQYAIEQMNRSFYLKNSKVKIDVQIQDQIQEPSL